MQSVCCCANRVAAATNSSAGSSLASCNSPRPPGMKTAKCPSVRPQSLQPCLAFCVIRRREQGVQVTHHIVRRELELSGARAGSARRSTNFGNTIQCSSSRRSHVTRNAFQRRRGERLEKTGVRLPISRRAVARCALRCRTRLPTVAARARWQVLAACCGSANRRNGAPGNRRPRGTPPRDSPGNDFRMPGSVRRSWRATIRQRISSPDPCGPDTGTNNTRGEPRRSWVGCTSMVERTLSRCKFVASAWTRSHNDDMTHGCRSDSFPAPCSLASVYRHGSCAPARLAVARRFARCLSAA